MSVGVMLVLFALGAAAIAVWVDVRFPPLAPRSLQGTLVHLGVSFVLVQAAVPPLMRLIIEPGSHTTALVALFTVAFPALTYCLLAAVWMIKAVHEMLGGRFR